MTNNLYRVVGNHYFFAKPQSSVEESIETLKTSNTLLDQVVVRASSNSVYILDPDQYAIIHARIDMIARSRLWGLRILLPVTAFHENIVYSSNSLPKTYYTFGNYFGATSIIFTPEQVGEATINALRGKYLSDVAIEISPDGKLTVERWQERQPL